MIILSITAALFIILGSIFIFYGIRNGLIIKNIQSGHYGSRAKGNSAIVMGILYIIGGCAFLWTASVIVHSLNASGNI